VSGSLRVSYLETDGFNAAADPVRYKAVNGSLPNPDRDGYYQTSITGSIAIRPVRGHEFGMTGYSVTGKNDYDGGGPTVFAYANVGNSILSAYTRNQWTDHWTSTVRFGQTEDSSTNVAPNRSLFETIQNQWMVENQIGLPIGSLLIGYEYLSQKVNSTTAYTVRERTVSSPFLGYNAKLGNHSVQLAGRRDDNSQFGVKNTGNLAYGYQFTNELSARGAIGTAFKAPRSTSYTFPGTARRI
jgi:vitamin B12 transporter